MTGINAIKTFFERADKIAPEGGRKVENRELMNLDKESRRELGELACAALGETYEEAK